jgi:ribosomal protein S18 acetylase RimI-like enzyme
MTLTAEKITAADADLFLAMAEAFHQEDGHPLTAAGKASIRDVAAGIDLAPAYFLIHNHQKIGFFVLSLGYSPEHGGTDGFIDDLYIQPEHRGQGLGRQALNLAIEQSRAHNIRVLLLEVEADNHRAYQLYTTTGFTDTKRRLLRLVLED